MKAAYILNNRCFEYLECESLELAESIIPTLFSSYEDISNISVIDGEDNGCLGIGYTKIDNVWYGSEHPKILGWEAVRNYRAPLLSLSDWTQIQDSPLTLEKKQEWAEYRQILRDITDNFENPTDVIFPEDPDGNNAHIAGNGY
jgi:hypothetical protein